MKILLVVVVVVVVVVLLTANPLKQADTVPKLINDPIAGWITPEDLRMIEIFVELNCGPKWKPKIK